MLPNAVYYCCILSSFIIIMADITSAGVCKVCSCQSCLNNDLNTTNACATDPALVIVVRDNSAG